MHFINPFKGLRPTEEKVSSVSIPSTDHLSQEIIINHKKDNPWSYLNIFSNEILSEAKEQFPHCYVCLGSGTNRPQHGPKPL